MLNKKLLCLCCCMLILVFCGSGIPFAYAAQVSVSAQSAIVMCVDSGDVLYAKNIDTKRPMASTTKIMTSLLALEEAQKNNKQITVTRAMYAEGSSMYLKEGERLTLKDLATGMMMVSGNDAANAVALSIADSFEDFAVLMNEKAQQIGMKNTSFVTPSGLDDDNHYSTAYDMALLMSYAMKNADFAQLTGKTEESVTFIEPVGEVRSYGNHNKLLKLYEYCIGGKTGFTDSAGRCLVTCAQKDGVRLVAVTLNAPDDWNDHIALYNYGFSVTEAVELDANGVKLPLKVVGGDINEIYAIKKSINSVAVQKGCADKIERRVKMSSFIYAPITAGEIVGKVTYEYNGNVIAEDVLVADRAVAYEEVQKSFFQKILDLFSGIFS